MAPKWKDLIARIPAVGRQRICGGTRKPLGGALPKNRPPAHPGEVLLEEFLKPLVVDPTVLARRIRAPAGRVWGVIRAEESVSADLALRLAKALGTTAEFWLNLQQNWDLWQATQSGKGLALGKLRRLRRRHMEDA